MTIFFRLSPFKDTFSVQSAKYTTAGLSDCVGEKHASRIVRTYNAADRLLWRRTRSIHAARKVVLVSGAEPCDVCMISPDQLCACSHVPEDRQEDRLLGFVVSLFLWH